MFSNSGKKEISAAMTILGVRSKPNQTTMIGASASLGIACEATM